MNRSKWWRSARPSSTSVPPTTSILLVVRTTKATRLVVTKQLGFKESLQQPSSEEALHAVAET
jgi:hypothetical protein